MLTSQISNYKIIKFINFIESDFVELRVAHKKEIIFVLKCKYLDSNGARRLHVNHLNDAECGMES